MRRNLILLLVIMGCSGQRDSKNKDVTQLRNDLPAIKTPVEFNSRRQVDYKSIDLKDNALVKELTKNEISLFGKIFETADNITLLGSVPSDIVSPILITFDNSGKQLSSHQLYETAGVDMGTYTANNVTVLPGRQVHFIDSTITKKLNAEGTGEIPGTDSLSVVNKRYRITEQGMIEVVN